MASPSALRALLEALRSEQEKRARRLGRPISKDDARRLLYEQLDLMAERRRMAPGYVPPSPEQRAAAQHDLDRYFAEHYGSG